MVAGVLVVIHTEREDATRLISSYEAGEEDRRKYYGNRILLFT